MKKILIAGLCLGLISAPTLAGDSSSLTQTLATYQSEASELKALREQISDLSPLVVSLDEGSNAKVYAERMLRIYDRLREISSASKHLPPFPDTFEEYRALQDKMAEASQDLAQKQVAIYDLMAAEN